VALVAYKATALISATNELIDDNMTDQEVWTLMAELIAEKIAEFEDTNVLASSTKFTALLADTTVNVVTMANTKDSFADITYDNLIDLERSIPTKYKNGNVTYFMHQDIIKYVEKLKDTTGQPIFYATRSLTDGQIKNQLLGRPLELTEVMPDDTDDGDLTPFILLGDLKFRAFGDRKQLSMSAGYLSGNREKDIQSLKANVRIAGKVIFAEAFAVLKTGTTTA
jgi:HK97 family phage major capsid protein